MTVTITIKNNYFCWTFYGSDEQLITQFLQGQFPRQWNAASGELETFFGSIQPIQSVPLQGAIIEIDDPPCAATLYLGESQYSWREGQQFSTVDRESKKAWLEVAIHVNGRSHLWSFPGSKEELIAAWTEGKAPYHLHPGFNGTVLPYLGKVEAINAITDILVEFQPRDDSEEFAEKLVVTLYFGDDSYEITLGQSNVQSSPLPPVKTPYEQLEDRKKSAGFSGSNGKIKELHPDKMLQLLFLIDALRDPCTHALTTLNLEKYPTEHSASVLDALISQERPALKSLIWKGDLSAKSMKRLIQIAPALKKVHTTGLLGDWPPKLVSVRAEFIPDTPPPKSCQEIITGSALSFWSPKLTYVEAREIPSLSPPATLQKVKVVRLQHWPNGIAEIEVTTEIPDESPPATLHSLTLSSPIKPALVPGLFQLPALSLVVDKAMEETFSSLTTSPETLVLREITPEGVIHLASVVGTFSKLRTLHISGALTSETIQLLGKSLSPRVAFIRTPDWVADTAFDIEYTREWLDWFVMLPFLNDLLCIFARELARFANHLQKDATPYLELSTFPLFNKPDWIGNPQIDIFQSELHGRWNKLLRSLPKLNEKLWAKEPKGTTFYSVSSLLDRLHRDTKRTIAGVFKGEMGNDYPTAVEQLANSLLYLGGLNRAWLGDGRDVPVVETAIREEIFHIRNKALKIITPLE